MVNSATRLRAIPRIDVYKVPIRRTPNNLALEIAGIRNPAKLKAPWITTEVCCVCGRYKKERYRRILCDKCREWVTSRLVVYLPRGWGWDEYDDWLLKDGHFLTDKDVQ